MFYGSLMSWVAAAREDVCTEVLYITFVSLCRNPAQAMQKIVYRADLICRHNEPDSRSISQPSLSTSYPDPRPTSLPYLLMQLKRTTPYQAHILKFLSPRSATVAVDSVSSRILHHPHLRRPQHPPIQRKALTLRVENISILLPLHLGHERGLVQPGVKLPLLIHGIKSL